jgi:hypothetical protein
MPTGERTKELSFRLWVEGKSVAEIQQQIGRDSVTLRSSVSEWIIEWERGRQAKWKPELSKIEQPHGDTRV